MKHPPGLALIIAEKLKGKMKESEDAEPETPQGKDLAEELIEAVGNKDADAVLKAFQALHVHCCKDEENDEEASDEEETDKE